MFNDNRYFDVQVEYAKADFEDILIKITVSNRGPEAAKLRLLPTIWFRNTWSWEARIRVLNYIIPVDTDGRALSSNHPTFGNRWLHCDGAPELLFTENETNAHRLYGVGQSDSPM